MEKTFDSLPVEAKRVLDVLQKNGMWPINENTFKKGRSTDDPIVIDFAEDYVRTEYLIAELLLRPVRSEFNTQFLINKDNRHFDKLLYDVTDKNGTVKSVPFVFDITVGYNALSGK